MNLLKGNVRQLFFRYFAAAFGSAMISSIYSIVDMAMVGQYQGPSGTAALAVVAPIWNIIYSLGLLTGIGGSVLFSTARGQGGKQSGESAARQFFTAALIMSAALSLLCWVGVAFFDRPLLQFFGADEQLMPMARAYLFPVKFAVPFFLFNQMLAAFLRNDGNPGLATFAVLGGGIFNIIGDYLFVFTFDLGVMGAGLATAIGAFLTFILMLSHFFSKKNTLKLVKPGSLWVMARKITVTGFSTFFIDIAMGILTLLFNRQIMKYAGADALAVYGMIVNISTMVQCCGYSIGQAAQPILSMNFGAGQGQRIRRTLHYALGSAVFFGVAWTLLLWLIPNGFVRIFMAPTAQVLAIAPKIVRTYALSFFFLPLNIFSTYYFQALLKAGASFSVSVSRGMVVSGILIYLLPIFGGIEALWLAMPLTELLVAAAVVYLIRRYTRALPSSLCRQA